ncbi:MAG: tyrosine-type recombinase/integrase [Spirochaetota bacterium]
MNDNRKIPVFLSHDEAKKLIQGLRKDRHSLGLSLMYYGGLRVSEMTDLRISDIHLARGFMKINGKGNKERIVPINNRLQKVIESYLQKHGHKLSQDSFLVGGDRRSWHYVVKKYSGLSLGREDVHCHTLRHSFATGMYIKGIPLERISQLLGHSKLDTTMIYSHISTEQKQEAVRSLDDSRSRLFGLVTSLFPAKKKADISLKDYGSLIGRDNEIKELTRYIESGVSVILSGPPGCGKSAILRAIKSSVFIEEFKKKQTLIKIILSGQEMGDKVYKEASKELKKLSIDELLQEIKGSGKIVVIDEITGLSKTDKKTIASLAENTVVLAASSRPADRKLFKTFIEIKPLSRHYCRFVLSEIVHMTDPQAKERIIDDILHQASSNLKEAEYIASQLQLGKSSEEITTDVRESNQVSIAPILLIFVLFFVAYVLKSYATSMVAFSYALLVCFRLVFYRFIFMPATSKNKG